MQTIVIDAANIEKIGNNEAEIQTLRGTAKDATGEANTLKLNSYCVMIAATANINLTDKNNFPTKTGRDIKNQLINMPQVSMSEGMANKMVKNTAGARFIFGINGNNITPSMVADIFNDAGITSEAKLIKAVAGDDTKTRVQKMVERIVGRRSTKVEAGQKVEGDKFLGGFLDEDKNLDLDEIQSFKDLLEDKLRERIAAEAEAKATADRVAKENDQINAMTDQF